MRHLRFVAASVSRQPAMACGRARDPDDVQGSIALVGVNLDEEAANMLRYQQAYQAAAQVIRITQTLFDTLLGATRR